MASRRRASRRRVRDAQNALARGDKPIRGEGTSFRLLLGICDPDSIGIFDVVRLPREKRERALELQTEAQRCCAKARRAGLKPSLYKTQEQDAALKAAGLRLDPNREDAAPFEAQDELKTRRHL